MLCRRNFDEGGGDYCASCLHPFIRCMITMEILPLIEFTFDAQEVNEEEALSILRNAEPPNNHEQAFHDAIDLTLITNGGRKNYKPIVASREVLMSFDRSDVYSIEMPGNGIRSYFKNMISDVGIAVCPSCQHFFQDREFEYEYLKRNGCPICLSPLSGNVSILLYPYKFSICC